MTGDRSLRVLDLLLERELRASAQTHDEAARRLLAAIDQGEGVNEALASSTDRLAMLLVARSAAVRAAQPSAEGRAAAAAGSRGTSALPLAVPPESDSSGEGGPC